MSPNATEEGYLESLMQHNKSAEEIVQSDSQKPELKIGHRKEIAVKNTPARKQYASKNKVLKSEMRTKAIASPIFSKSPSNAKVARNNSVVAVDDKK